MSTRLHLSLEMFQLVEEHLSPPNALTVKLNSIIFQGEIVNLLLTVFQLWFDTNSLLFNLPL
jgi:hypothetical protein